MEEISEAPTVSKNDLMTWTVDASHSNIQFIARHMVISKVTGEFKDFTGTVKTKGLDFEHAEVEFEAKTASVDTGNAHRDGHLQSDDFFNAEQYPTLKFKNTSIRRKNDDIFEMEGDLTIRDITKRIKLDVEFGGVIKDPYGLHRAGFNIRGKVKRSEYNLKWNALIETGGAVVSDETVINCDVEITSPVA